MSNNDLLTALEQLKLLDQPCEFVYVVGSSDAELWQAVSAFQRELETTYHKPLFFILEAYPPTMMELPVPEVYVQRLENSRRGIENRNLQVVASRSYYTKMDGSTKEQNNAGIVCGLYAKTEAHQSIGRTREVYVLGISQGKMTALTPAGIEEYTERLDAAGYLTFRSYDGLSRYYVTGARVMSGETSDYRYAEDIRTLNKIITEVRKAALPLLQEDIDSTDTQKELERMAKFMEVPLDKLTAAGEISSAKITVPEGQDLTENGVMRVNVRYQARGYIRSIEIDVGRSAAT